MRIRSSMLFVVMLIAAALDQGCGTQTPIKYSHALVRTYAELLVFHEKEKMIGTMSDSLYRRRLKDFFAERKIDEGEFRNQITRISRDDVAWRLFLNEATAAVDSIKSAKPY
jgi:hypothetical protein